MTEWINEKFFTHKGFSKCNTDEILEEIKTKEMNPMDRKILFELSNRHGLTKLATYFLKNGVDINNKETFVYPDGSTITQSFVLISKDLPTLKILMDEGADINEVGVVCTSSKGNVVISNILGAGAAFGRTDILTNILPIMKHGIEHKAIEKHEFRKIYRKECTDYTPLMLAFAGEFSECLESAKILLKHGANPKCVDFEGNSILHIAVMH